MNTEKQRIAIAEACGWTVINGYLCHVTPDKNNEPVIATIAPLPDYLNDLNAMHEAEQCLWRKDYLARDTFVDHLARILNPVHGYRDQSGQDLLDATASQRAEAFLRTIGQWSIDHP